MRIGLCPGYYDKISIVAVAAALCDPSDRSSCGCSHSGTMLEVCACVVDSGYPARSGACVVVPPTLDAGVSAASPGSIVQWFPDSPVGAGLELFLV